MMIKPFAVAKDICISKENHRGSSAEKVSNWLNTCCCRPPRVSAVNYRRRPFIFMFVGNYSSFSSTTSFFQFHNWNLNDQMNIV